MRRDFIEELKEILNSNLTNSEKKEKILQYHESDIADFLEELEPEEQAVLLELLGDDNTADVLSYVEDIDEIVDVLTEEQAAEIIELMDVDDAIEVLEELEDDQRERIVALLDEESQADINLVQKYDEDLIGSRLTTNYITISTNDTIKTAMRKVINDAAENDNVSFIYVVDDNDILYGVIELRDLIIARQTDEISKITKTNYPFFNANYLITDCLVKFKEYGLDSYPIVDDNNKLIGVITADDVVDVLDEELSDDYAKLAGLTEEEEINDSVFESVKKRLPWLLILLILGLFQSFAMTGFEHIVAALPIIVFFQTLVLSMSGNSGTQSLAVTIRVLSDQVDGKRQILKAVLKELRTGFLNGFFLGLVAFTIVFVFMAITKQSVGTQTYQIVDAIKASGIVAVSLLIAMTVSSCIGTLVPILFLKLKIDPAVASGPFITTISDITALLIYYGLAYLLFLAF